MIWGYNDPRWRRIDFAFVVLTALLFAANILAWWGVPIFGEKPYRPLASLALSATLFMQALASIVRRRSIAAWIALAAGSLIPLWIAITAA